MNINLEKIEQIINEEITKYQEISELYDKKQKILIEIKADALCDIDVKIMDKLKEINLVTKKRLELAPDMNMSDLIAQCTNSDMKSRFEMMQKTLNQLAIDIQLKEKTNIDLLEHGAKIVNKTVELIVNNMTIETAGYNAQGKMKTKNEKLQFSSIVEEV